MADRRFETSLEASGPWSFSQSVRFLEAFTPAAIEATGETVLRLAFVPMAVMSPLASRSVVLLRSVMELRTHEIAG